MGLCSSAEEDEKNVPISPPEKNTKFKNEEQLAKLLKSIPLLSEPESISWSRQNHLQGVLLHTKPRMSQEDRRKIVVALKEETISEGEDIIRQGDVADKFYIIKKVPSKSRSLNPSALILIYSCRERQRLSSMARK
ncbi:hypothetical protein AAMO2058_000673500 [Amorphochlora amoebiformis]